MSLSVAPPAPVPEAKTRESPLVGGTLPLVFQFKPLKFESVAPVHESLAACAAARDSRSTARTRRIRPAGMPDS